MFGRSLLSLCLLFFLSCAYAEGPVKPVGVKSVVVDPRDEATMLDYRLERTDSG